MRESKLYQYKNREFQYFSLKNKNLPTLHSLKEMLPQVEIFSGSLPCQKPSFEPYFIDLRRHPKEDEKKGAIFAEDLFSPTFLPPFTATARRRSEQSHMPP